MTQKHTHKLRRHKYKSGEFVFFCILPDCHFKISSAFALGKRCLCNLCGNEFIITEYTLRLVKPHCDACSKQKVKGLDGKNHYIRRTSLPIVASLAAETSKDLRDRMEDITREAEEDVLQA